MSKISYSSSNLSLISSTAPVYYANPDDCKSYCECSNNHAYKLYCGPQTVWDETNKRCDWAQNVDCGSRPNN